MRILAALVVIAVIVALIYGIKNLTAKRRQKRINDVLEELREVAWQYRDIAPDFSTIMIDEINKKKKENK